MSGELFGPWPGDIDSPPPTGATGPDDVIGTLGDEGIPYWEDAPELWDTVRIAGENLPGNAKVTGDVVRKLTKSNAKGVDGATITDDGADPTDIEIEIVLATREQWKAYQRIVPLLDPNVGKGSATAVDIVHPALALHKIVQVYVERVSIPIPGSDPQTRVVRIKATGWLPKPPPAPSKLKTPDASKGKASDETEQKYNERLEEIRVAQQNGEITQEQADAAIEKANQGYQEELMNPNP